MSTHQSKYQKVQKNYVEKLDDFLNITMNDLQVKQWTIALAKYDTEVLKEGWDKFLYKVRPGLMPAIEDCTKLMQEIQMQHSRERHNDLKREEPEHPKDHMTGFKRWMKAVSHGLIMRRNGWSEIKRKEFMIDEAKACGMDKKEITDLEIELATYKRTNPNEEESPI